MRECDLCVIGSGPAGQRAAIQAAKLGKSVVLVERRDVVGGVAVNTGTIPSKALREAILVMVDRQSAMPQPGDFRLAREHSFRELIRSADRVVDAEIEIVQRHMRSNGVLVVHGVARFVEPHVIAVEGGYQTEEIRAAHVLIATGTEPARPEGIPFDQHTVLTSDEILELPELPHSMIVVGGGVIGTEYASMLSVLGVKVTLIEGRGRILGFVDGEIGEALQYHLRQGGMTLRMGERVVKISRVEATPGSRTIDNAMAEASLESGKTVRADCLLYAIGRQGATAELHLGEAGLEADPRGRLKVNEHFQTSVPHIYAAGDVIGFPALASTSMEQGRSAACHMFGEPVHAVSKLLPYGIYSIPELSMVGWTEEALTEEGIPFETGVAQYRRSRREDMGSEIGLECERLTEQIIGAAIRVHQGLGPGLLENTYEACLCHELAKLQLRVQRQVAMPVRYDGVSLDCGYRLDLLVEESVVVELKAVDKLDRVHEAQLITYLKLGRFPVGLLINFNTRLLKDGIVRRANTQATLRALRDLRGSIGVSQ